MDKNTYYVRVGTGEIFSERDISEWEYEIQATEEEITQLRRLFDRAQAGSDRNFLDAVTYAYVPDKLSEANAPNDNILSDIYQTLYNLGDEKVKDHINSMGIL